MSPTLHIYDAAGNRIAKGSITSMSCDITSNHFQQIAGYVVGAGGEQLTEVGADNTIWNHTNVYAGGKLIGTYDSAGLHFHIDDPLGTRRAQVSASGTLEATCQSLTYGYGTSGTNNGNILSINNGLDSSRNETFSYDNLNRLQQAYDSHWGETYTYDPWGNMYQRTPISGHSGDNFYVTADGSNHLSNLTYDADGRLTLDQLGNTYTYDAEGRILTANTGTYVYDGDGNRVKKTVGSITTLYWPGATGGVIDESNSAATSFGKQVYVAGLQVWSEDTSGTGKFLLQDHLGSTRITGDTSGTVYDDIDYLPFGDIYNNYGSASDIHYQFTGDETDSENSTDYAVYRNLSGSMARFNRPDPYDGSYEPTDPQSLNRYAYVGNRPLQFIDPFGLDTYLCTTYSYSTGSSSTDPIPVDDGSPDSPDDSGNARSGSSFSHARPNDSGTVTQCVSLFDTPSPPNLQVGKTGSSSAPSSGLSPLAKCRAKAVAAGVAHAAIDGLGVIPGEGVVAAGFYGGAEAFQAVQFGSGLASTAYGLGDKSTLGVTSTSLGTAGIALGIASKYGNLFKGAAELIPGVGQVVAGVSVVVDGISAYQDYQACSNGGG